MRGFCQQLQQLCDFHERIIPPSRGVAYGWRPSENAHHRIVAGWPTMLATLAFFLMAVVLMVAVIGDALWGHFRRRSRLQRR